ncbi:thioredoxin family protein [Polynucleobacter kasalickyi]|uniref:thioredoxin family protein n=1 Tax=Polynucleobacter kasalickyi TaxID=1938817 RepID=UPI00135A9CFD|nr:thioredoxin domain-containing protein [Polynucleobacter kasalickyi]
MSTNVITELNQDNFQEMALAFKGISVVDFWSATCLPCKQMTRILEEIVQEIPEHVRISKINADDNPLLVQKYSVRALPTLLFFKDGKLMETKTGVDRKQVIRKAIESYLN